jgi:hypothetical protein
MWSINLEAEPRQLNRPEFHRPDLARKGDKWHNPSAGVNEFLTVEYVTKYVDPRYESIWYVITFSDPLPHLKGLNIAEGLGMGTFYQGALNV